MIPLLAINIDVQSKLNELSGTGNFTIITSVGVMVSRIIGLFLAAGTLAAFVYFVWGGLQMITAGSDKGKVEEARSRITNAIIGLVVIAISWAVFGLINYFFGLNLIGNSDNIDNPYSTPTTSSGMCPCNNGLCATSGQFSQLSGANDCRICTNGIWTTDGAPASCPNPITCVPCR